MPAIVWSLHSEDGEIKVYIQRMEKLRFTMIDVNKFKDISDKTYIGETSIHRCVLLPF